MKTKPLAFLVWLITMTSFGQQPTECATPRKDSAAFFAQPWVQDPNYLEDFRSMLDSVFSVNEKQKKAKQFKSVDQNVYYRIPIRFWIYESEQWANPSSLT